jgi:hypothetical protein
MAVVVGTWTARSRMGRQLRVVGDCTRNVPVRRAWQRWR